MPGALQVALLVSLEAYLMFPPRIRAKQYMSRIHVETFEELLFIFFCRRERIKALLLKLKHFKNCNCLGLLLVFPIDMTWPHLALICGYDFACEKNV